ncbi:hypothetical protein [Actinomycetospora straminea]|uniref:IraD/Gp25-like domain-containing protein n=1 Tax=Actinomycetospora straminea TaxID=663607 RepID=A0ABP9EQS8_9PSEU|nr:hypothetical protein [Actinomycetospora straminea]MDD7933736.1 hypothetical protein [Actinomycetospora straminea]
MTSPTPPRTSEDAEQRALGWALRCDLISPGVDIGRDIRLRHGRDGLDLDLVSGVDCLTQHLAVALTTLLGSDVLNTTFGFAGLAAIAEEQIPVLVQERLRVAVVGVLNRDPRVRRIVDVKIADLRLDAPSPGSRELGVRVVFETVTDDRVAIDLGRLVPVA